MMVLTSNVWQKINCEVVDSMSGELESGEVSHTELHSDSQEFVSGWCLRIDEKWHFAVVLMVSKVTV
ncbi:hypothetical protein DSO57_1016868 [Entomophthora muscae]|uniref:Uncharacterized protein n=1 Tax=Entomophthora muscae TaxID=34485 RepID=A0ACC2RVV7_9FUNG|nr:hypothetical protein DSO57_1016868 [Entomophthora muscae]